jgi:hypothetical protein
MGFEYKIRFAVPEGMSVDGLDSRMKAIATSHAAGTDYEYKLEADGFYFLDHVKSPAASIAFRRLVDEALRHGSEVVIQEL